MNFAAAYYGATDTILGGQSCQLLYFWDPDTQTRSKHDHLGLAHVP